MFVTAVYGVLDLESGRLHVCKRGAQPAALDSRGRNAQELHQDGHRPRSDRGERSEGAQRASWQPGESLLLFTDGVTEAFAPNGSLFGEAGLMEAVHSSRPGSAEGLVEAVEGETVCLHAGAAAGGRSHNARSAPQVGFTRILQGGHRWHYAPGLRIGVTN